MKEDQSLYIFNEGNWEPYGHLMQWPSGEILGLGFSKSESISFSERANGNLPQQIKIYDPHELLSGLLNNFASKSLFTGDVLRQSLGKDAMGILQNMLNMFGQSGVAPDSTPDSLQPNSLLNGLFGALVGSRVIGGLVEFEFQPGSGPIQPLNELFSAFAGKEVTTGLMGLSDQEAGGLWQGLVGAFVGGQLLSGSDMFGELADPDQYMGELFDSVMTGPDAIGQLAEGGSGRVLNGYSSHKEKQWEKQLTRAEKTMTDGAVKVVKGAVQGVKAAVTKNPKDAANSITNISHGYGKMLLGGGEALLTARDIHTTISGDTERLHNELNDLEESDEGPAAPPEQKGDDEPPKNEPKNEGGGGGCDSIEDEAGREACKEKNENSDDDEGSDDEPDPIPLVDCAPDHDVDGTGCGGLQELDESGDEQDPFGPLIICSQDEPDCGKGTPEDAFDESGDELDPFGSLILCPEYDPDCGRGPEFGDGGSDPNPIDRIMIRDDEKWQSEEDREFGFPSL